MKHNALDEFTIEYMDVVTIDVNGDGLPQSIITIQNVPPYGDYTIMLTHIGSIVYISYHNPTTHQWINIEPYEYGTTYNELDDLMDKCCIVIENHIKMGVTQ